MVFTKNLSPSEAKYKYVGFSKKAREEFPEKDVVFKMKFKGKTYDMKVNNKDCIMLSQLYERHVFQEYEEIKISKIDDKNFELTATK